MINKSIKTIKENPILLLVFFIPVVYSVISSILLPDKGFMDVLTGTAEYDPVMIIGFLVGAVYYVGWTIFLYPPIIYRAYEAVADKKQEGWYMRGLKGYWWRNLVFSMLMVLIFSAILLPVGFGAGFIAILFMSRLANAFAIGLVAIVMLIMASFMHLGMAAIFSEKDFGVGLGNILKSAKKNFFRVFPVAVLSYVPTGIAVYLMSQSIQEQSLTMVVTSILTALISVFASVYSLHCYADYKNGLEQVEEEKAEEAQ